MKHLKEVGELLNNIVDARGEATAGESIMDDIYKEIYDEDISAFIPEQITTTRFE